MLAARKHSRDSYAESDSKGAEPVDVGAVGNLNSGVNVLGGTPIKPQSERMTQENQLHRCSTITQNIAFLTYAALRSLLPPLVCMVIGARLQRSCIAKAANCFLGS